MNVTTAIEPYTHNLTTGFGRFFVSTIISLFVTALISYVVIPPSTHEPITKTRIPT